MFQFIFIYLSFITNISNLIFLCSSRVAEIWWNITQSNFNSQLLIIALVTKYLTWTFHFPNGLHYLSIGFPLGIEFFSWFSSWFFKAFETMNNLGWAGEAESDWYDQEEGVWILKVFCFYFFYHFFSFFFFLNFLFGKYQKCLLQLMKEKWSSTAYHINTDLGFPRESFSFVSRWFFLLYLSCLNDK